MKKIFVLSVLISFAMICSCQKQESASEGQLAQRKAELDAREKALDEREKTAASAPTFSPALQPRGPALQPRGPVHDPSQLKAERDRRLQQLPPEVQKLIPDPSRIQAPDPSRVQAERAEKDRIMRERVAAQTQRSLEEVPRTRMPRAAVEATSPSPSPTPQ